MSIDKSKLVDSDPKNLGLIERIIGISDKYGFYTDFDISGCVVQVSACSNILYKPNSWTRDAGLEHDLVLRMKFDNGMSYGNSWYFQLWGDIKRWPKCQTTYRTVLTTDTSLFCVDYFDMYPYDAKKADYYVPMQMVDFDKLDARLKILSDKIKYREKHPYDSTDATMAHKREVKKNINRFCAAMNVRAIHHDDSKLVPPEKAGFDDSTQMLSQMEYNSPEYQKSLENLKTTLDHHYSTNDHHPQHFENGVNGMSLYSLVEMFYDWLAATKRNKNGDIFESIKQNAKRFNLSPQLVDILTNTAKLEMAKPLDIKEKK